MFNTYEGVGRGVFQRKLERFGFEVWYARMWANRIAILGPMNRTAVLMALNACQDHWQALAVLTAAI